MVSSANLLVFRVSLFETMLNNDSIGIELHGTQQSNFTILCRRGSSDFFSAKKSTIDEVSRFSCLDFPEFNLSYFK